MPIYFLHRKKCWEAQVANVGMRAKVSSVLEHRDRFEQTFYSSLPLIIQRKAHVGKSKIKFDYIKYNCAVYYFWVKCIGCFLLGHHCKIHLNWLECYKTILHYASLYPKVSHDPTERSRMTKRYFMEEFVKSGKWLISKETKSI